MSYDWRLRADALRHLHPTRKLLLLKLAEHTNPTGWCDLAIDTVADYANISPDQARRLLHRLERDGFLAIEIGGGRSHANRYWPLFGLPPADVQRVQAEVATRNAYRAQRRPIRPPLNADADIPDLTPAPTPASSPPTLAPAPQTPTAPSSPTPTPPPQTPASPPPTPTATPANPGPDASRTSQTMNPTPDQEPALTADQLWTQTLDILSFSMTRPSFEMWLRPTRPLRLDGDILTLTSPSEYAADWLGNRLRRPIERALCQAAGRPIGLQIQLAPRPPN